MKTGLVLEGGGMRGLFSEGFIDVMQEQGITVDGMIGVSAGALFGCNFKSHQPGRGLRYNIRFKDDPRYMGWGSFLRTGNFVNAQFAYHTMPMQLDVFDIHAFEADPTEFHLVCTDIKTGQPVYRQINHVEDQTLEWFRATGSMPIVSTPVEIDGMKLWSIVFPCAISSPSATTATLSFSPVQKATRRLLTRWRSFSSFSIPAIPRWQSA